MKEKKVDFYNEKDILGQDKSVVFISADSEGDNPDKNSDYKLDHSNEYELPTIKTRYFSLLIDVIAILLISLGASTLFEKIGEVPDYVRGLTFLIVVILYEPILISTWCTFGQLITNIRVRNLKNPEIKIWFIYANIRLIVKSLLGWLSFLTITFNNNRRAIHDFASGSIVVVPKD